MKLLLDREQVSAAFLNAKKQNNNNNTAAQALRAPESEEKKSRVVAETESYV